MVPAKLPNKHPEAPGFEEWHKVAQEARDRAIAEYQRTGAVPAVWADAVWREAGEAYLNRCFHGKCAFCEARDTGHLITVRHLRPIEGFPLEDVAAGDHHGYFWLAYEWYNLVPACGECVKRLDPLGGAPAGFPMGGVAVTEPPDSPPEPPDLWRRHHEQIERPHVLDPYCGCESFRYELVFTEDGHVIGQGARGETTRERFNLDRETLVTARMEAWKKVLLKIACSPTPEVDFRLDESHEFSAWLNDCLERFYESPRHAHGNGMAVPCPNAPRPSGPVATEVRG